MAGHIAIGGTTMTREPSEMTMVRKRRITASLQTYGGVAFFTWGASILGKTIEIGWPVLEYDQFAFLQTLLEANSRVVFDPQDGSSKTYNVELISLDGKYFIKKDTGYRKDVRLVLIILSEVA